MVSPRTHAAFAVRACSRRRCGNVTYAGAALGRFAFSSGGATVRALRYTVHVHLGGTTGAVAPLVGKEPPDTHIWITGGKAARFLKSEGPLFVDGPVWRIEVTVPALPKN